MPAIIDNPELPVLVIIGNPEQMEDSSLDLVRAIARAITRNDNGYSTLDVILQRMNESFNIRR
ncbi:hypothetical protein [Endozoicomonas sp. SCSIO W0465]|uniref:hypothetical protein n=1 Tax=Endozoicomonas sp. SCSIO W0465 TaxID=2918516 RepID=UPI0020764039|nr:hypothetical protein [Endozoicomonas sp. SCSIO W0465]USE37067.1 hypothetical protein MJO57_02195 [Endozoicomonas sp. SCSIO W0465]